MNMECVVAKYVISCDSGMKLDRERVSQIIASPVFSDDETKLSFTVYDDSDTAKAQKIRGKLFYAQVPQLTPPAA